MAENTATDSTAQQGSEVDPQIAQAATGNNPENEAGNKSELNADDLQAALRKAREEAARYRVERNEFRDDAEKFREQQEAEKSELQKAQEALAAQESEKASLAAQVQRLQYAAQYGIAEDNLDLLGNDPEKFEDNAKKIASLQETQARRSGPPSDVPVEDLKPGASAPKESPDYSFPSDWPVNGPFANN